MGKRGPAPKPTNLRRLHGDRADRINTDEPQPDTADVERPDWVLGVAAEVWDRLAPDLIRKHVLTAWDVDAFAAFCAAVAVNRAAWVDVEVDRHEDDGGKRHSAAWKKARESSQLITMLGSRFGLTPSDRAQLSIPGEGERDSTEDLLTG